jgi:hypothetical protein
MRSRISWDSFFLPTRSFTLELRLQYLRKPARCQRATVSGVTMMRELFQADQNRCASTQKSLSRGPTFGLRCLRFSTVSCCRSTKFSKSSVRCERKQRASTDPDRDRNEIKQQVADEFHLPCVDKQIQIPDARIEYELDQGSRIGSSDIEVVTGAYRPGHLRGKAQAGFRLYAASRDRARLGRDIEDDHHMLHEILDL